MKKVFIILLATLITINVAGCGAAKEIKAAESTNSPREIYNDELMQISFVKIQDSTTEGIFEFYLQVKNNANFPIKIYLQDAHLNSAMFLVKSEESCDVLPQQENTFRFSGEYMGTEVFTVGEITELGFAVCIVDEALHTLKRIENICIEDNVIELSRELLPTSSKNNILRTEANS